MKNRIITTLIALCSFSITLAQKKAVISAAPLSSIINVDYKSLVSRSDLHYSEPAPRSEAGIPVGNGKMGTLLWTNPSQLKMQINRVDVFGSNSATNNFWQRNSDYCGGTAFADLDFLDDVFVKPAFNHHLSCYDGLSDLKAKGLEIRTVAWNAADVLAFDIKDSRKAGKFIASLRTLRLPVTSRGNHSAISKVDIVGDYIVLSQEFKEDDYYCATSVVIGIGGLKATPEIINDQTVRLKAGGGKNYSLFIASAASFNPSEDVIAAAIRKLEQAKKVGFENIYASNKKWWADFWSKSFIKLSSADKEANFVEQNYTYYLYIMGSSSRGDYPVKFNGMLWTTGGDPRKWGGAFWGANQSCLYNALFPTNHLELLDPLFNLYSKAYTSFERCASQQWGSKGIFIPETVGFDGVPALPENIAAEMRALYLVQKPWDKRSAEFMAYAETKQPFLSRWNWKKDAQWKDGRWPLIDRGGGPFSPVGHIISRGAKIAYQYWLKYEYTKDTTWLRDRAYPMLKGMAEFYRNFPNVRKEKDGKYHIYHVNDNESIWNGHNTVEEISSIRGIFPALIKASEILNTDNSMRPVWKEFLQNIAPLSTSKSFSDMNGPEVFVGSLRPWATGNGQRKPDGNTMPVWFFDLCNLQSDPEMLKIANATYNAYFPDGISKQVYPYVLSKIPAAGAILGRADAVKYLVPNQIRRGPKDEVLANRMDLSEGFYTTNIQRLGRAADALHLGLNQTAPAGPGEDNVIHVFPAWPSDWNAQYSLLARGNFLITSSINKGEIEFVELLSQSGSTCMIKNPWKGERIAIFRNGKMERISNEEIITAKTEKGDRLILVKEGIHPDQLKRKIG